MLFLDLDFIEAGIRRLMAMLCGFIYPLISVVFNIFMNISKVNILSNSQIKPIYSRVTLILTIVMTFYVIFNCVKYVVQPEAMTDKEKGVSNIVVKLVLVVVLIAFVPKIFDLAFEAQNIIIDENVIGKVILGTDNTVEPDKLGNTFSSNVLGIGYSVKEKYANEECGPVSCGMLVAMNLGTLQKINELPYITIGLEASVEEETPTVNKETVEVPAIDFAFSGFFSVALGIGILWMLVLYCVDVGIRWAQLIYLQIISPIAIIGYLSPKKDGVFQKWLKQCITTYLDLFLRIALIYIILLLCSLLMDGYNNPGSNDLLSKIDPNFKMWVYVFLILGVMGFAKKAPKLIADLFPKMGVASGNFGLSTKDRGLPLASRFAGAAAGAAIGAGAGLATGIFQGARAWKRHGKGAPFKEKFKDAVSAVGHAGLGAVSGAVGGAGRGLVNGAKKGNVLKNATAGAKNQIKANRRFGNNTENNYSIFSQIDDTARAAVGARSRTEIRESRKGQLKRELDAIGHVATANDDIRKRAEKKMQEGEGGKNLVTKEKVSKYRTAEQRLKDFMESPSKRTDMLAQENLTEDKLRQKLEKDLKETKDAAINAYIDNEDDTEIANARATLLNHLEYDLAEKDLSEELRQKLLSVREKLKDENEKNIGDYLDTEIVKQTLSPIEKRDKGEQLAIDRELEVIKRQQQGNTEGKK